MKESLKSCGFPRSGNTYLNQALNLLYYPTEEVNLNKHTVVAIKKATRILVTFRNPIDSIASWHNYPSDGHLKKDVEFYLRFYCAVLENLNKIVLMDFETFTKNIDYIKNQVFNNFGFVTNSNATDYDIKYAMIKNNKKINLPRNNQEELMLIKEELKTMSNFEECLQIHENLKNNAL